MHFSDDLLRKLDVSGPRYTSYPTADRFVEAFGPAEYAGALRQRAGGATVGGAPALSIYVHVPFCESVCYYCACNKIVTRHHDRAAEYLRALRSEIELHVAELGRGHGVSQIHFGGGTPTFLSDDELAELMSWLREGFAIAPGPRPRSRSTPGPRRRHAWPTSPRSASTGSASAFRTLTRKCNKP